jgi:hypothetical protein
MKRIKLPWMCNWLAIFWSLSASAAIIHGNDNPRRIPNRFTVILSDSLPWQHRLDRQHPELSASPSNRDVRRRALDQDR